MNREKLEYVRFFEKISAKEVAAFGGKNASLGEMIGKLKSEGIKVPQGFATTADAYREFLEINDLNEKIAKKIKEYQNGKKSLKKTGKAIRAMILKGKFTEGFEQAVGNAYRNLCEIYKKRNLDVAVRSSGTAEDLPSASFAGQQETYLNIKGPKSLLEACRKCIASLFTDRAIYYRENRGFDHLKIALSVGVQKMVRADKAGSGVMFSLETESGFPDFVLIDATWGLGELIVKGSIDPDEYIVYKPLLGKKGASPILESSIGSKEKKMVYASGSKTTKTVKSSKKEQASRVLSDEEILKLANWCKVIEKHYGKPMDIEWAKDGESEELYIVQARPETVHSQERETRTLKTYRIQSKGEKLLTGLSVGKSIAVGNVRRLKSPDQQGKFKKGEVLVTEMTDPDWVPIMKKAAGIITDHGGRTSHAAIVSRELGIPAIVGTDEGTTVLKNGQTVTLSCAEGSKGFVYEGEAKYAVEETDIESLPDVKTNILLNIAEPAGALSWWKLPSRGVGLARMEFIISNHIKIHPMALAHWKKLQDKKIRKEISKLTEGYSDKEEYFVDKLASGIAKIAAVHHPRPVIVRMSDFKTNEYAQLIGGKLYEPDEENPMLGWRGASRYYHPDYREGFALECRAIRKVREHMGLDNVKVMIPFCRTLEEADRVLKVMKDEGLVRGLRGLEVYVMCEVPSNVLLAEEFSRRFDGFSIGSNDLTQLVLGVDRDSDLISDLFDEKNPAVKKMIREVISQAKKHRCSVGICGQAPSDYPEFARFLVEAGIDSISVTPDSFAAVLKNVAQEEKKRSKSRKKK